MYRYKNEIMTETYTKKEVDTFVASKEELLKSLQTIIDAVISDYSNNMTLDERAKLYNKLWGELEIVKQSLEY